MNWKIGSRHTQLRVIGEVVVPPPWGKAFPTHREQLSTQDNNIDIVIDAHPTTVTNQLDSCKLRTIYNADKFVTRAEVHYPSVEGVFRRVTNGYHGTFIIGKESIFGLMISLGIGLSLLVEEAGGLWLHSSGIWRDGRVWLFCGPSGAGKTTIATDLHGSGKIFTEDESFIEFDEDGTLIAHAIPFGDPRKTRDCPTSGTVAGICFIRQSADETSLCPMAFHEAASRLFTGSRWCDRDKIASQRVLDNIEKIVQTNRCCELSFTRYSSLWPLLEEIETWDR